MRFIRTVNEQPIVLEAIMMGQDIHVSLFGGEQAHIGAIALAQSRPSTHHSNQRSTSTSVITVFGHKEDALAKQSAERIAIALGGVVTVSCGIHFDSASHDLIQEVIVACDQLVTQLIEAVSDDCNV